MSPENFVEARHRDADLHLPAGEEIQIAKNEAALGQDVDLEPVFQQQLAAAVG